MRLLITRPATDGERSARRLIARGHETVLAPLMEIVARSQTLPEPCFDGAVATSHNAFAFLDRALDPLAAMPLYVVGDRTAGAARARGWANVAGVAKDVRALVAALMETDAQWRWLYLAGEPRKPELEAAFAQSGRSMTALEVYRSAAAPRLPADASEALAEGRVDAVLHYSERSAALFVELVRGAALETNAAQTIHVAISPHAAAPLRAFAHDIRIADQPDEASLFRKLEELV